MQESNDKRANKCVFLDRDGVLNQDLEGYLYQPDEVQIPDGVKQGLARLKEAGYLLIVITNQAGIAKGLYTATEVWSIHRYLNKAYGGVLDDLYFAPHHEDFDTRSLSRKPGSLLLERAMAKYAIDPLLSWMIGDNERDIQAGSRVGVKTVLIKQTPTKTSADFSATCFEDAVNRILNEAY